MTKHYHVAIATPGKMLHAEYVQSLVKTLTVLHAEGITYTFLNRYTSFVATARELTAIDSPQHDYTHSKIGGGRFTCEKIFWIDSDIEWEPEDFLRLYRSSADVISGLYALDYTGLVAVSRADADGIPKRVNARELMFDEDPVPVSGVGFGFLCVRSSVWESIPRPWFLIGRLKWSPDTEMRVNVGEDYSWCGRAVQEGYQILVDPTVRVKHHKEAVICV